MKQFFMQVSRCYVSDIIELQCLGDDVSATITPLPDYFTNQEFFLYGDFDPEVRRLLHRHILACNGLVALCFLS